MLNSIHESLPPILLAVEDNDEDFAVLERIVKQTAITCQLDRCLSGDQALTYLKRTQGSSARPSLILLDLNLPGTDGAEILRQIKQTAELRMVPIVVLSGNLKQKEVNALYQLGISGYIVKQVDGTQFKRKMQLLIEYWFIANQLPTYK